MNHSFLFGPKREVNHGNCPAMSEKKVSARTASVLTILPTSASIHARPWRRIRRDFFSFRKGPQLNFGCLELRESFV
jgi:hypothetical protein